MRQKFICLIMLFSLPITYGCSDSNNFLVEPAAYERMIEEKDLEISDLEQQLNDRDQEIQSLRTQVSDLEQRVSSLKNIAFEYQQAPRVYTLVNGTINVPPGSYYHLIFIVTLKMKNAKLEGYFQEMHSTGFSTCVFDDPSFQNWANRVDSHPVYDSGKVVEGKINLDIASPGTYYLVFSNRYSVFSARDILTTIRLEWLIADQ
jgi:hypothetical protein